MFLWWDSNHFLWWNFNHFCGSFFKRVGWAWSAGRKRLSDVCVGVFGSVYKRGVRMLMTNILTPLRSG